MVKYWLPVLICMGIIFYASSLPASDILPIFAYQDILFHFLIYAILAYFIARALKNTYSGISPAKTIVFALTFAFFYAITDELHQMFVPGRYPSGMDLWIDGIGGLTGSIIYR